MSGFSKQDRPVHRSPESSADAVRRRERESVSGLEPTTIRDDEVEVYDLGFIVEDRIDERICLLSGWQRLDDLDTDEALETNPAGSLPDGGSVLRAARVAEQRHPGMAHLGHTKAERDEATFAAMNGLAEDPDWEPDNVAAMEWRRAQAAVAFWVHASRVPGGSGTMLPQDIGAAGFSLEEPPAPGPDEPLRSCRPIQRLSDPEELEA
jgi:hypothetical protein